MTAPTLAPNQDQVNLDSAIAQAVGFQSGQPLYQRNYKLTIGTLDVSQLRCIFLVSKSKKANTPNTCNLKVYNLNEDHRLYLDGLGPGINVLLEAGYQQPVGISQIYFGQVRAVLPSVTEGPDIVTELTTGDGEKKLATSRINVGFAIRTPPDVALRQIAAALGVGSGNIDAAVSSLKAKGFASLFSGVSISGKASYHITNFCKSANLEWSVQDGKLQILDKGTTLDAQAILLNAQTGLIGSPSADSNGIVSCTTLLIPGLAPCKKIVFDAKHLKGNFRIITCEYSGDTRGQDWYCNITAKKLS